jgi:hypothetical protein
MSDSMFATFCVCLTGMLALAAALYQVELKGKRIDERIRELRELLATEPARPPVLTEVRS